MGTGRGRVGLRISENTIKLEIVASGQTSLTISDLLAVLTTEALTVCLIIVLCSSAKALHKFIFCGF